MDLAVKAAREAFDHGPWPRMSGAVSISIYSQFGFFLRCSSDYSFDLYTLYLYLSRLASNF